LLQLQEAREELDRLEVQTLVVTFEGREAAREYLDETGLVWPLLVDSDRRLYRAYHMQKARLRHLWGFATMRAYGREALRGRFPRMPRADSVQQGGNVLIDPAGIVRFHHVGSGPADRPTVATVFAARAGGR
jgi:alkyl hydroperoxide reductase subunit AhpC